MQRTKLKANHTPPKLSLAAAVLLCACQTQAVTPQIVTQTGILENCEYLSEIKGDSGYGKHANWQIPAKHQALQKASSLGATHVAWVRFETVGGFNGVAVAKVYRCQP